MTAELIAIGFVTSLAAYGGLGVVFAALYHAAGLARVDHGARGAGTWFRVLITPGLVGLWPLVLFKWRAAVLGREPFGGSEQPITPERIRRSHALAWQILAIVVPALAALVLAARPTAVPTGCCDGGPCCLATGASVSRNATQTGGTEPR